MKNLLAISRFETVANFDAYCNDRVSHLNSEPLKWVDASTLAKRWRTSPDAIRKQRTRQKWPATLYRKLATGRYLYNADGIEKWQRENNLK